MGQTLKFEVEIEDVDIKHDGEALGAAIRDAIRDSTGSPEANVSVVAQVPARDMVAQIARLDTSEDKLVRDAIREFEATSIGDITEEVHAGQLDGDWYSAQSDTLDALVLQARSLVGTPPAETFEERVRSHPDYRDIQNQDEDPSP